VLNFPQARYRLVGVVDEGDVPDDWVIATERQVFRPTFLGGLARIPEIIAMRHIDEVVIALPPTAHEQVMRIVEPCRADDVDFTLVPDLFELTLDNVVTYDLNGLPLIGLNESRIRGWNYAVKRAMDMAISLAVLVVCAIPMALIAIAIRLDSTGPVLFRQERVGKNKCRFTVYKFRTMHRNAEEEKARLQQEFNVGDLLFKIPDDPRRTRVGRFLRHTSLDELTKIFNILMGDMSVVGPRPQVPTEVAYYQEWHCRRLEVTPGVTGLWQVNGRSNLSFDEMVKLDLYYIEHWSPWLDIKLMLRTIPAVVLGRGAY
jgi:exopolysaccharide biosynthesis polyprenyl glycosylphosphotransferase